MSLSSLIRGKSEPVRFATATVATFATPRQERGRTVASVATVTVAKSPQGQTATPAKVGAGDPVTAARWWLIHFIDRDPVKIACCPEATHAEILEWHPDAIAAEPFEPIDEHRPAGMTERHLIEELAAIIWRKRRVLMAEGANINHGLEGAARNAESVIPAAAPFELGLSGKGTDLRD